MAVVSAIGPQDYQQATIEKDRAALVAEKVGQVYAYFAAAFAISLVSGFAFAKTGLTAVILAPFAQSLTIGLLALTAVSVALLFATKLIPKESVGLKHATFGLFAVSQGLVISLFVLVNPTAIVIASAGTVALTGGLGALSMTLKESFEKYKKILLVALGAIVCASLGSVCLLGAAGAMAHEISLFGGFGVFSCFVIYHTHKARSDALNPEFDPINRSVGIYLDALTIFVRIWAIVDGKSKKIT